MEDVREVLEKRVHKDCAGLIVQYLLPLPKLPYLDELEVRTHHLSNFLNAPLVFSSDMPFRVTSHCNAVLFGHWTLCDCYYIQRQAHVLFLTG
jgi:hypothetical protein